MALLRRTASSLNRLINFKVASSNCYSLASPNVATRSIRKPQFATVTYRFFSSEIDLSNEDSKKRTINRLLYRSKQRGFLELDLVLGKWVEDNIHSMDENGITSLVEVLDLENPDLWNWLSGQEQPPESVSVNPIFTAVREKVASNLNSHAAPETRAIPGQPWVRGWDDIKRGKDAPISGNQ